MVGNFIVFSLVVQTDKICARICVFAHLSCRLKVCLRLRGKVAVAVVEVPVLGAEHVVVGADEASRLVHVLAVDIVPPALSVVSVRFLHHLKTVLALASIWLVTAPMFEGPGLALQRFIIFRFSFLFLENTLYA